MSDLDLRCKSEVRLWAVQTTPLVGQGSVALTLIGKVPFRQDSLALKAALPDSGTNISA